MVFKHLSDSPAALLVLYAAIVAGSGSVFDDPYGNSVRRDAPDAWWRLDDAGAEVKCLACTPSGCVSESADPSQSCNGVRDPCVESVIGIPGSDAVKIVPSVQLAADAGKASKLIGLCGFKLPTPLFASPSSGKAFTAELWFQTYKIVNVGRIQTILSAGQMPSCDWSSSANSRCRGGTNNHWGFELFLNPDQVIGARLAVGPRRSNPVPLTAGNSAVQIFSRRQLSLFVWNHITLTYDGQNARLYLNGTAEASVRIHADEFVPRDPQMSRGPAPAGGARAGAELLVGKGPAGQGYASFLIGLVDEVAVYSRALQQAKIVKHVLAAMYDPNVVRPHGNCTRPPQTHTNIVQSCDAAALGGAAAPP